MTKSKKYSLRFILTGLFTLLMLSVGGVIGTLNYTQISRLLLSASDKIYDRVAEEVVLNYYKTYSPVFNSLKLLSHSSLSTSASFKERLAYIGVLSTALNTEESITAVQVGYENGDFFIVRKLNTDALKTQFNAPERAVFLAENTDVDKTGAIVLSKVYLDVNLKVVKLGEDEITDYDPRIRPWFNQASSIAKAIAPYYFFFMHEVGTTITMKMHQSETVIATDLTLKNISNSLMKSKMTSGSEMYLVTSNGTVIASSNKGEELVKDTQGKVILKNINELPSLVLTDVLTKDLFKEQKLSFRSEGKLWQGAVKKIGKLGGNDLYLLAFTPVKELLNDAIEIGLKSFYLLIVIIMLALPVVWFISKRMSVAMQSLAAEADKIMHFDFSASTISKSKIKEVDELSNAQNLMKSSLSQFISLINSLAIEKNFDSLLEKITSETLKASQADAVATYLIDDESKLKVDSLKSIDEYSVNKSCLPDFTVSADDSVTELFNSKDCKYVKHNSKDDTQWQSLAAQLNIEVIKVVLLPLRNRQSEFMGIIALVYDYNDKETDSLQQQSFSFIQAFSKFAAVSLESKQLLKMQEDLLDAFIKLIAGAIDAKSPYTGGHCQRVPEIAKLLAKAACDSDDSRFSDYSLTDDQWQELHIASWLHDCGKVTTPEYVVDKSTKLETIYDRIHEIRTRFEVLKRDAEIEHWKAVSNGGDIGELNEALKQTIQELNEDFEFVATCNQGGEFMQQEKIDRLNKIADKRWMRTLNDRSGVSWEEENRMKKTPEKTLPVEEHLLSDKPEHIIERLESEKIPDNNQWGFRLDVPKFKFNMGELYNLSVKAGTLTGEERYIINGHMIQTIKMLDELPFPAHLKEVPAIAGGHHESMDGKGYPKRLSKEDMSLTARMMAIADIFEALTASDRPYKKAKSLSVSLKIMSDMRDRNHIDGDLFDLFLGSGVYLKYAEKYLSNEQIDIVDIEQYLSS